MRLSNMVPNVTSSVTPNMASSIALNMALNVTPKSDSATAAIF